MQNFAALRAAFFLLFFFKTSGGADIRPPPSVRGLRMKNCLLLIELPEKGPGFWSLNVHFLLHVSLFSRCTYECVKYADLIEIVTLPLTGLAIRKGRNSNSISGSR